MQKIQEVIINFIKSKFYFIFKIFFITLISLIVLFSVDIFSPYHSFTNISDSMTPVIDKGSVTIVKKFDYYEVGDIITYYDNSLGVEEIVTHRITGMGGNVYLTKGDANEVSDRELVKSRLIIGRVIYVIPFLGYLISFSKSFFGNILCIIAPASIIVFFEIMNIIIYLDKRRNNK